MPSTVLVTGGAGYIGSHTCVELLQAGYEVVVVDNLANSSAVALDRVQELGGRSLRFVQADITDRGAMDAVLSSVAVDSVVHFAGLKAVGESVQQPLRYYSNNVAGTTMPLACCSKRLASSKSGGAARSTLLPTFLAAA